MSKHRPKHRKQWAGAIAPRTPYELRNDSCTAIINGQKVAAQSSAQMRLVAKVLRWASLKGSEDDMEHIYKMGQAVDIIEACNLITGYSASLKSRAANKDASIIKP